MPGAEASIGLMREAAWLAPVIREAGTLARSLFRTELRHWIKGASSPVTEADIAVNELLRTRIGEAFPDDGWLSEESADDAVRLGKNRIWVVDPIDGTRAYLAGRNDWSISVALVRAGRPVLAAVFAPASEEFFYAVAGQGATLNEAPIRVSAGAELAGAEIGAPQSVVDSHGIAGLGARIAPKIGSLALRLARVAQGRLDAAIVGPHSHDWDLAAADLLVHEAGGVLTTLAGDALAYNRPQVVHDLLICAGRPRHSRLIAQIGRG